MSKDKIVWIDLEMTGLDIDKDTILEIACAITDFSLQDEIVGPDITIKTLEETLQSMDPWCIQQHGITGLTDLCQKSSITLPEAEAIVLDFIREHVKEGSAPLAGNTVYMDRLFLRKYMPKLNAYLHYRIIDVSSLKELMKRWNPTAIKNAPKKVRNHRAMDDVLESINELRHYKKYISVVP